MSVFAHLLIYVGTPAIALGTFVWRVSRAVLLYRAGAAALRHGDKNSRGRAGLEIVKALTGDSEPWYRALMPWRKPDDGS